MFRKSCMNLVGGVVLVTGFALSAMGCTIQAPPNGGTNNNASNGATPNGGDSSNPTNPTNGGGTANLNGGTATPSGETCQQIADCTQTCTDTACTDACVAKGSPSAQEKYGLLQYCINTGNPCMHDDTREQCLQMACKYQIDKCLLDVAPKYAAPLTPGSGIVPADLAGAWISSGGNINYNFNADGTYTETTAVIANIDANSGTPDASTVYSIEGIVQFNQPSDVTFSQTSNQKTSQPNGLRTDQPTTTEVKSWVYEGGSLYICDYGVTVKEQCSAFTKK